MINVIIVYKINTKLCKFNVYSIFSLCVIMCLKDFYAGTCIKCVS